MIRLFVLALTAVSAYAHARANGLDTTHFVGAQFIQGGVWIHVLDTPENALATLDWYDKTNTGSVGDLLQHTYGL